MRSVGEACWRALNFVKRVAPRFSPPLARWHEASGYHTQAAEEFEGIAMPEDALRNWRLAGTWEKALRLASGQDRENLEWLGQLEERMAAKPPDLKAWLTPAEKIRLKKVLHGDETEAG